MKAEVIKHSASISITNRITLLQRQAYNVLLANAYDELQSQQEHEIAVSDLLDQLKTSTRNVAHVRDALRGLTSTTVEWNVLGRDGAQEWGAMSLLAQVIIKEGICRYAYAPHLRKLLHNPRIYSKIKLAIQCKFSSKHALALYELACDFRGVGETPWIDLDGLKKLTDTASYTDFNKWRRRVLDVGVREINKSSDLHVTVLFEKVAKGRVERIKFKIEERPPAPPPAARKKIAAAPVGVAAFVDVPAASFDLDAELGKLQPEARLAIEEEARAALGAFTNDIALRAEMKRVLRERQ